MQQVVIKHIYKKKGGGKLRQLQICVQISEVSGAVPLLFSIIKLKINACKMQFLSVEIIDNILIVQLRLYIATS